MKNSGIILMYNCSGPEYSKLRQIFAMLRLRMHPITPDRYHLSLTELALGHGEGVEDAPEAFEEKMLVFCGLNKVFLNQVLAVIRTANLPPIELKAALTATNKEWDSVKLHEELVKERKAMLEKLDTVRAEVIAERDGAAENEAKAEEEEKPQEPQE